MGDNSPEKPMRESGFDRLVKLMAVLRGGDGCAWDKLQTLKSLQPYVLEEACELIDAMEDGDSEKLKEELGDLIFETVFVAQVCSEEFRFDMCDVIDTINEKMVRRHPHIFGETSAGTPSEVLKQWHEIKAEEKKKKEESEASVLDRIPSHLPALHKAQKVQRKVARVGFDWTDASDVLNKVEEEFRELRASIQSGKKEAVEEELGDLLFAMVNVARFMGVDAESALRSAVKKFCRRFREIEANLTQEGVPLEKYALEEMDAEWDRIKLREKEKRRPQ